ncbi:AAA family ATPase [Bacteroides sp. 224]|uniref:cytidylate kinase-like family protein n=1 Tax=Bacteroides sp. 224 TaxID=2302936 RepID=UPI0013D4705A|nr:cytidylate kinase-like family protein [Bacteroides sp. 224]NDV65061.1 cytidylate kinase-like family protein [Bacteroides sp. 224]
MKDNHFVINIGRQLGSGGREIGTKLAEKLGISFYDKELINLASKESGLCKELFEKADEKPSQTVVGSFLGARFSLFTDASVPYANYLSNDTLFKIQSDVIRDLAAKQSCIFVGRCADYILRDFPRCVNVFISAPTEDRVKRLCATENLSEEEAKEVIRRTDKKRSEYYNYYSYKTWGAAETYHLCIDSSILGMNETILFIEEFAKKKLKLFPK